MYRLNPSNYHHQLRVTSTFGAMALSSPQILSFCIVTLNPHCLCRTNTIIGAIIGEPCCVSHVSDICMDTIVVYILKFSVSVSRVVSMQHSPPQFQSFSAN